MNLNIDYPTIWLTLRLALTTTIVLLLIGMPTAWWLGRTKSRIKKILGAFIALPLVLPPTVIGFYLLLLMSPTGFIGQLTNAFNLEPLPFTFSGLVCGSVIYSLPFVVQPLQNAFEAIGERPFEVAATLGANAWDRFFTIALPMAKPGILTASILGFAHTVGEFGIVLMIGGNIPGKTKVISTAIYDHVEANEYSQAHWMAALMLVFSFLVLLLMYSFQKPTKAKNKK